MLLSSSKLTVINTQSYARNAWFSRALGRRGAQRQTLIPQQATSNILLAHSRLISPLHSPPLQYANAMVKSIVSVRKLS
jgi:hypothetical protein